MKICSPCANKHGGKWPEGHIASFWDDLCPHCNKRTSVACTFDWTWRYGVPKVNEKPAVHCERK
jgi:hypothetical protein